MAWMVWCLEFSNWIGLDWIGWGVYGRVYVCFALLDGLMGLRWVYEGTAQDGWIHMGDGELHGTTLETLLE